MTRRPPMPEREAMERVLRMVERELEELRFMERFLLKRLGHRAPAGDSPRCNASPQDRPDLLCSREIGHTGSHGQGENLWGNPATGGGP